MEVKDKDTVVIKLIQVNDVYEIAPLKGGKVGGMARVGHISDSIKKAFPNSYLVMGGDFLNPSLLGTLKIDGKRIKGKQMIEVMNAMDFDIATFGNHEFDLNLNELQDRLNESEFQWTSANVFQKNGEDIRVFNTIKNGDSIPIPEKVIYDIPIGKEYPLRLGFFSVTLDSNPVDWVYYSDYMLEARSAYTALEQSRADIIIGLTHLSIDQDKVIAESLPGVALIMGGHEHKNMLVSTSGATIAKADANAKTVYVHTLRYNTKTEQLKIDSELLAINDKVSSLSSIKEIVDRWEKVLDAEIKQVIANPYEIIYETQVPLVVTDAANRSTQSDLGIIITEAMAKGFDIPAEAAIVNGGSFRLDDTLEGEITSIDIFRVLPFGGIVLKVEMMGALLKEVLDYGESQKGTGAFLQRYNIENKNGVWLINGVNINEDQSYTIAVSDFLLKGYDIPFLTPQNKGVINVYNPKAFEPAYDIRKTVIDFMKRSYTLD
ncbi:bifunctional metallophosphatase/5'-nucleotidase [Patiriisocius sp. Uisw_017]|uniref:bifunctional metallophosphatase/5'-nucleotidase n=1 Tax=Patiriisocius sp. Uisw_017 TaxID=3230968 RepID=UPI0039E89A3B